MTLDLNDKEWQILTEIVDSYLPELRLMVASGGRYDIRTDLKKDEEVVKTIIDKLHQGARMKKAA
jgi:hypothetical protein